MAVERVTEDGIPVSEVAAVLGVDARSVRRWVAEHRDGGADALAATPHPGRPRKLSPAREAAVLRWVRRSPAKFGFPDQLWTAPRLGAVIRKRFGIGFNSNYLCSWLSQRRITPQKPQRVAAERNRRRIRHWRNVTWPRLLKKGPSAAPPLS